MTSLEFAEQFVNANPLKATQEEIKLIVSHYWGEQRTQHLLEDAGQDWMLHLPKEVCAHLHAVFAVHACVEKV